ncbi:MAG: acyltransferase [Lachnospiraceae bacterium]|nr:acyltransferase [Lachnospiraceae bacterium]
MAIITLHFPFDDLAVDSPVFPFFLDFTVPGFMFMSGYLRTLSIEKKGFSTVEDAYSRDSLVSSLLRLVIPYTLYFVFAQVFLRIIGFYTVGIKEYGLLALVFDYLRGFNGPGAYYFPIMIQFVFVFPIIWRVIKKKGFAGVWIIFAINLAYEVIKQAFGMSGNEYMYLIFRYLFIIACGSYAAMYKPKKSALNRALMIVTVAVGIAFIWLFVYSGYGPSAKIITGWQRSSLLTCLYAAPLFFVLVTKGKMRFRPLEMAGKASYNIYLVQMLYYVYFHFAMTEHIGDIKFYPLSIVICVVIGIAFYFPERYLTKYAVKKLTRS